MKTVAIALPFLGNKALNSTVFNSLNT